MSQMQKEMDEWELLGQHGTGVQQVLHQRLPLQAGQSSFSPFLKICLVLDLIKSRFSPGSVLVQLW